MTNNCQFGATEDKYSSKDLYIFFFNIPFFLSELRPEIYLPCKQIHSVIIDMKVHRSEHILPSSLVNFLCIF